MHWMLLPLKRYAEFHGRSTRTEFWMFALFQFLLMVAVMAVAIPVMMSTGTAGSDSAREIQERAMWLIAPIAIISLGLLIPNIAVTVRRLHDQNLTGWLYLVALIPYLGGLVILVLMCLPGTRGPNRFGPDPLGRPDPNVAKVFS